MQSCRILVAIFFLVVACAQEHAGIKGQVIGANPPAPRATFIESVYQGFSSLKE